MVSSIVGSSPETRGQNPHYFSVQIRHSKTGSIVGTGIVVSEQGHILTCAHVVWEAGVNPRLGKAIPTFWSLFLNQVKHSEIDEQIAEVGVYFPKTRISEAKLCRAKVTASFPEHEDDIVLLQVTSEVPPLSSKQIARLGIAESYLGHKFHSYGFKKQGEYPSGYATGEIMGSVETPCTCNLQVNPVELRTSDIDHGMSGAGVLDQELNLVVGLIVERSVNNTDVAWAIDSYVLKFEPISLQVLEQVQVLE